MSSGQEVQKNSSIKTLIPMWDEENQLLKHNSRIINHNPINLPKNHIVTKLLSRMYTRTEFDNSQGKKIDLEYMGKTIIQERSLQMHLLKNHSSKWRNGKNSFIDWRKSYYLDPNWNWCPRDILWKKKSPIRTKIVWQKHLPLFELI